MVLLKKRVVGSIKMRDVDVPDENWLELWLELWPKVLSQWSLLLLELW
jgi:hypothetical protein